MSHNCCNTTCYGCKCVRTARCSSDTLTRDSAHLQGMGLASHLPVLDLGDTKIDDRLKAPPRRGGGGSSDGGGGNLDEKKKKKRSE